MTQQPRTTESINRDHDAIRAVMKQARELTVPDRATLTLGLVGHLATLMNRAQMGRLLDQLREEAERVQDVPPSRQADMPAEEPPAGRTAAARGQADRTSMAAGDRGPRPSRSRDDRGRDAEARGRERDTRRDADRGRTPDGHDPVGQAGRGEFRSGRLL
jgi:hypothetical protein